jgi:hypothetical protein
MNIEIPYENDEDRHEQITVRDLIEMLQKCPSEYEVKFDSACGQILKGYFTIFHDTKEISLNG